MSRASPNAAQDPAVEASAGVVRELYAEADERRAAAARRYFQAGPRGYGAGDRFLGIRVPVLRRIARHHRGFSLATIASLLHSGYHEVRLVALFLLVDAFERADPAGREAIVALYLASTRDVNNWDLVDASAPRILGTHLLERDTTILDRLAASPVIWERRIAVLATLAFIRQGRFDETLRLARTLLDDPHDLMHKAVGWMLREVGKRDLPTEERFLATHCREMPRTMLRYAIEKLPPERRAAYLRGDP